MDELEQGTRYKVMIKHEFAAEFAWTETDDERGGITHYIFKDGKGARGEASYRRIAVANIVSVKPL